VFFTFQEITQNFPTINTTFEDSEL
jgi:hypothetical protein